MKKKFTPVKRVKRTTQIRKLPEPPAKEVQQISVAAPLPGTREYTHR